MLTAARPSLRSIYLDNPHGHDALMAKLLRGQLDGVVQ